MWWGIETTFEGEAWLGGELGLGGHGSSSTKAASRSIGAREKQIKSGSRARKLALIEKANPTLRDLWEEIL